MSIEAVTDTPSLQKKSRFPNQKRVMLGAILGVLLGLLSLSYVYLPDIINRYQARQSQQEAWRQQQLSRQKTEETIAAVAQLIELPDEEPTVATINDLSKLQGQPFFAQAEEGDRVLFFARAQKAILYRPTANKLIEVSALELEN